MKKFNLGSDAIGKHIGLGNTTTLDMEIVGVARDATYNDVKDEAPALYLRPYRQIADVRSVSFYVRGAGDPEQLLTGIPKMVAAPDATLPVVRLRTLEDQFRENVFLDRMMTILAVGFAVLAIPGSRYPAGPARGAAPVSGPRRPRAVPDLATGQSHQSQ